MVDRKNKTQILTKAAMHYYVKKNYGVSTEIGVTKYGKLRADLLAFNMKKEVVIVEVKSCKLDFTSDKKWQAYLPYCNKFYFIVNHNDDWIFEHSCKLKQHGAGIMMLGCNGYVNVEKNAATRVIDETIVNDMMMRMAWRGAQYNKKNTPRRVRLYV